MVFTRLSYLIYIDPKNRKKKKAFEVFICNDSLQVNPIL